MQPCASTWSCNSDGSIGGLHAHGQCPWGGAKVGGRCVWVLSVWCQTGCGVQHCCCCCCVHTHHCGSLSALLLWCLSWWGLYPMFTIFGFDAVICPVTLGLVGLPVFELPELVCILALEFEPVIRLIFRLGMCMCVRGCRCIHIIVVVHRQALQGVCSRGMHVGRTIGGAIGVVLTVKCGRGFVFPFHVHVLRLLSLIHIGFKHLGVARGVGVDHASVHVDVCPLLLECLYLLVLCMPLLWCSSMYSHLLTICSSSLSLHILWSLYTSSLCLWVSSITSLLYYISSCSYPLTSPLYLPSPCACSLSSLYPGLMGLYPLSLGSPRVYSNPLSEPSWSALLYLLFSNPQ